MSALGIAVVADRAGVGKHLMEHPGVNFGCYLKREARLPADMRRQMFAGLRWSSKIDGCPAGDMYIIPSNKAAWHGVGHRLGLLMMWVNRSYLHRRGAPHLARSVGQARHRFQHVLGLARHGAHDHRRAHDDQAAGASRRAADLRADLPGQLQRPRAPLRGLQPANEIQMAIGGALMDLAAPLRRLLVDTLIADGPSIEDLADESTLKQWIADTVLGHWHATSTCRMGASDDPGAVTDPAGPRLRRRGPAGLRRLDHADGALRQHQHPDHHGGREDRGDDARRAAFRLMRAFQALEFTVA